MTQFIWNNENYSLNLSVMDDTHKEFIDLYHKLINCNDSLFPVLFDAFVTHTKKHFYNEDILMEKSHFPAITEHKSEHQRVLNELSYFESKVKENKYSFARFYIKDRIPQWFKLHLATMDSALAAHLKNKDTSQFEKFA